MCKTTLYSFVIKNTLHQEHKVLDLKPAAAILSLKNPRTRTRDASQQHPRPIKGVGPAEEGETHPRLLLLLRRHLSLHPTEAVVQTDAGEHALRDGGLGVCG